MLLNVGLCILSCLSLGMSIGWKILFYVFVELGWIGCIG